MYALIETWPSFASARLLLDVDDKPLLFKTYDEAFVYGEKNLQYPIVVDIPAGRKATNREKQVREIEAYAKSIGTTTDHFDSLCKHIRTQEEKRETKEAPTSLREQVRYVFGRSLDQGLTVEDCRGSIAFIKWLTECTTTPRTNPANPANGGSATPLPHSR